MENLAAEIKRYKKICAHRSIWHYERGINLEYIKYRKCIFCGKVDSVWYDGRLVATDADAHEMCKNLTNIK